MTKQTKPQRKKEIPKQKIKDVKELTELAKTKKTILIASIKNLPASQFQEIGKKLRGKASVKVPKRNLMIMAIEATKNSELKKLEKYVGDSVAILFSDLDSFELAGELVKNKSHEKAKTGQIAPNDIEIEAGPTSLVPGPAISELGALGIQIQIEKGKINIKESKIIAKKGEKITQAACDIMAKLEIKPFSIGFVPIAAFDNKEGKIYTNIKIDREGTIEELKKSYSKALAFAVEIAYTTQDTIRFLLAKAASHERALINLQSSENIPEVQN